MGLFDRVRDLPVSVEDVDLHSHDRATSSGFDRRTTVIELRGDGRTGRGEDVTYEAAEHETLVEHGLDIDLAGSHTFESTSDHLDSIDLFPAGEPERSAFRHYRRWGVESALLDLALRQADTTLGEAVGRDYDAVRFVVSTRLGEPPTADRVHQWLEIDPSLEFKLDVTPDWSARLVEDLVATDSVRILDLKGHYEGTEVDQPPDPAVYRRVVDGFPGTLLEDPKVTNGTRGLLDEVADRVTWDAPIEHVDDIDRLPWRPDWLNVKPSRFGTVRHLFDFLDEAAERGIQLYGGGQFELAVGRGQIQVLASLFYPDGPNDVAPGGYNDPEPGRGLPNSPLDPPEASRGFRW